jgi:hypothetical protein
MSFEWLQMRIAEEKDRRARENAILSRLPSAFEELRANLAECVEAYNQAFEPGAAKLEMVEGAIELAAGDARVEVTIDPKLPGFRVDQRPERLSIEVGLLPGNKLSFRDAEKYLTVEEMTRRILDRALFPKLGE